MKKLFQRVLNCIAIAALVVVLTVSAQASSITDIQNQIKDHQNQLGELAGQISGLEDEKDILEEQISDLDAEVVNTMTSIALLEDNIESKTADIGVAQTQYEAAKETEEAQYEAMKVRIRLMYENGSNSYLALFLESDNFSDMLNKADYVESLYEYDRKMLLEYQDTKNQIADLWAKLEEDKKQLEGDKANMEDQKVYLDGLLAKKKKASANFEAQIAQAKQQAAIYKTKIQQEQAQLKKMQDQEKRNSNAMNGNYSVTGFDVSVIDKSSGSDLGKKIAKYACQYIGYPYVLGGTSLTGGADCSGFVYRVYSDFGYSLPRTSYEQRSVGSEVSYDSAQPGDIICYDGHVGIYVGGGYIVHASTPSSGIKISKATYRSIAGVRRVI